MAIGADQDSYVQVATDGSGKKIDNALLTRDDGTVIERQRVVISSDENPLQQVKVAGEPGRGYIIVKVQGVDELICKIDELIEVIKFQMSS